jgi:predicted metalloprotease with PDZ domain
MSGAKSDRASVPGTSRGNAPVRYRIAAKNPGAHLFEVTCTLDDPSPDGQEFRMPAWIPGSYLIREFAKHVVHFRAACDGKPVAAHKTSKDTWRCAPCSGPLAVTCEIYAWDLSVRGAHLDTTHAFFNGTSVFLSPAGFETRECRVEIERPQGPAFADWRVISSLPRAGAMPYDFGTYRAADYDELIDHPVEMGAFALGQFEANGVRHDIAVTGRHDCDMPRLTADLARLCATQIDFFGGTPGSKPPMDYYAFLTMALGEAHGGLEHRASTALVPSRQNLPNAAMKEPNDDYIDFLGLASHEYFHTWCVKRIKPAAFVPYDLAREAYTRQLWIFEGFTSYYDNLLLLRSGLVTAEKYLELLGQDISKILRGSGRGKQSVADSSFDAWIKYYRQDENAPNAIVSYYVKGALVALLLDLTLRERSKATLDDVMRTLWRRHGETGVGVPEDGVRRIAEELSGLDLSEFFARYVDGTEELPLAEMLGRAGIDVHLRPADGNKDKGGKPGRKARDGDPPRLWLGARWAAGDAARITHVFDSGPAQDAGLSAGDVIVAWNALRVSGGNLQSMIERSGAGGAAVVHAFRRDELMTFDVSAGSAPLDTCWLTIRTGSPDSTVALRERWLRGA